MSGARRPSSRSPRPAAENAPSGSGPSRASRYGREVAGLEELPGAEAPDVAVGDVRSIVQSENSTRVGIVGQRSSLARERSDPVIRRWISSDRPESNPTIRYLPRRPTSATRSPTSSAATIAGSNGRTRRASRISTLLEACPLEHGRDRPADGLDLGQLGHGLSLGSGSRAARERSCGWSAVGCAGRRLSAGRHALEHGRALGSTAQSSLRR